MSTWRLLLLSEKCVHPGIEKAGWMEWGGMEEEGLCLCPFMLCVLNAGICKQSVAWGWKREKAGREACIRVHVLDHAYGRTVFGGIAGFRLRHLAYDCHLVFFTLPPPHPPFCVVIITIFSFLTYFSPSQPPPLAGLNPVGCNPRGAPDTVNSPFTCAAELLQTFLLIFTGLKASPFSLIIP